jgi:hypothetical protein
MAAFLGACLALPLLAGSASAITGSTYWVDADGMAGPANCDQTTPASASTTIQAAVDLTAAADIVKVCPGTYLEDVVINGYAGHSGITLVSVEPFKAKIQSPDDQSGYDFPGQLISIYAADGVTVQWFRLAAKVVGTCSNTAVAVAVFGGSMNTTIIANRIRPTGANTWNGPCGLLKAVRVEGPSNATISYNLIKDWTYTGIDVAPGAKVRIKHNSMRTRHAAYDGANCFGVAISSYQGNVTAAYNQINQPVGVHPCQGNGISIQGGRANIRHNTIDGMFYGIELTTDGTNGPWFANVANNRVMNSNLYRAGIKVWSGVAGANIHDNDASGNDGLACDDDTTGTGTASTANTWTNNVGPNDDPDGICSAT